MVSQLDVARMAGVSPSTASLALNNHPRVAPKTTLHVQTVAKRLGYVPNHAARQLIRARFGSPSNGDLHQIGVVSCMQTTNPLNSTDMAFLNGAEQAVANRAGILVYLRQTDEASTRRLTDLTRAGTVEGWVIFGHVTEDQVALLDSLGRPWVVLGDHTCSHPIHHVNLNFRLMGELAVRHLADQGHSRIGFVGSRMHFAYPKKILAGFHKGMEETGLTTAPRDILLREAGPDPRAWLADAMAERWRLPSPPTALVYCEPGESGTMLSACSERGIRVPDDVSLVFCEMTDGLPFTPDIARIEVSAVEAGRAAVSLLLDIAGKKNVPARQVLVAPRVVSGWSAAASSGQRKTP